jgi:hypothetical protein
MESGEDVVGEESDQCEVELVLPVISGGGAGARALRLTAFRKLVWPYEK